MAFWRSAPSPPPPPTVEEDENDSSSDSDSDDENAIAGVIDTRTPAIQQRPPAHGYDEYDDDTYNNNYSDTDQYTSSYYQQPTLHQRHQYDDEQYYTTPLPPQSSPPQPNIAVPSSLSELHSVVERAQYKQQSRVAAVERIRRQSINVFDPVRMQQAQQYRIIHDKAPITIHRRRCLIYILIALTFIILLFIISITYWDLNSVNDRFLDAIQRRWKKNETEQWNDRVVLLEEDDEMLRRRNDALIHGIDVIVHTDDTSPDVVKRQYHHLRYHSNGTNEDHPMEEHKELHLTDHAADGVKKLLDTVLKQENNHIRVTIPKEDGEQYGGITPPATKSDTKKSDAKKASTKPTTKPVTKTDSKSTTKPVSHQDKKEHKQQHKQDHQHEHKQDHQQEHQQDHSRDQHENQHDNHENVASHHDDTHNDHSRNHDHDRDYEDEHDHEHSHRSRRRSHHSHDVDDDDDYHSHHHHSHGHTSHDYEKETRERPSDDKIRDQQRARERARRGRSYSGGIVLHGTNNNRDERERDFLFFLHVPLSAGTGFYQAMIKAFGPASPPQFSPSCASTPACVERMSTTRVAPRYDANYLLTPTSTAMIRDPHLFRAAYNMYDIGAGHADISISSVLARHHIHYITLLRPTVERFLSLYHTLHATTNQLRECMIAKIAELQAARERGDGDVNKELSIAQLCDTYAHLRTTPLKANTVDELNREIQDIHLSIRRGLGDTRLTPALLLPPDVDIVRFGHLLKLMGEENYITHMLSGTTRGSFQGTQSQRSLTDASILATAKQTLASSPFIGLTTKLNESMELFLYTFNLQLDADEWHTIMETDAYGLLTIVANSIETSKALLASPMIADVINKIEYLDNVLYEYATILFDQRYAQMLLEKAER